MANIKLEIKGIEKTINELRRFGEEGEKAVSDNLEFTAREIQLEAQRIVPVDTGKLKQSITADELGDIKTKTVSWYITAYESYARWVELGKVSQPNYPAQPYLYPSWKRGIKQFNRDLKASLRILINKFNK